MLGSILNAATQPLRAGIDVLEGLSEGQLRRRAAIRLGADVVAGMALSEVIDFLRG